MTDSVICPADVGMIYDDRSLLHIGYDEHGHHFEAITVKRKMLQFGIFSFLLSNRAKNRDSMKRKTHPKHLVRKFFQSSAKPLMNRSLQKVSRMVNCAHTDRRF